MREGAVSVVGPDDVGLEVVSDHGIEVERLLLAETPVVLKMH